MPGVHGVSPPQLHDRRGPQLAEPSPDAPPTSEGRRPGPSVGAWTSRSTGRSRARAASSPPPRPVTATATGRSAGWCGPAGGAGPGGAVCWRTPNCPTPRCCRSERTSCGPTSCTSSGRRSWSTGDSPGCRCTRRASGRTMPCWSTVSGAPQRLGRRATSCAWPHRSMVWPPSTRRCAPPGARGSSWLPPQRSRPGCVASCA